MGAASATNTFDRPAASETSVGTTRVAALDITRAVAIVGVVTMNYHGYLNGGSQGTGALDRIFDPWSGVLGTRFAAVFVVVAGASASLITSRSRQSGDTAALRRDRLRLSRRGLVLLIAGLGLEHAWPGTIIFYYGAYMLAAAWLFDRRVRSIAGVGVASAAAAAAVHAWEAARNAAGHATGWLHPSDPGGPRDFMLRVMYDYTHPLLPWLAFFCAGLLIGRNLAGFAANARRIAEWAVGVAVMLYTVSAVLEGFDLRRSATWHAASSMKPFSGSLMYTASTLAIAVIALSTITALCRAPGFTRRVSTLQRAGQMTLSMYLLHVVVFYAATRWTDVVTPGLANALLLAAAYSTLALVGAAWWHHRLGRGPAEWLYRRLSP